MKNKATLTMILFSTFLVLTACSHNQETPIQNVQFRQFKLISSAGPCQAGVDCYGFIELDSQGTLTYDKFGEVPEGTIHITTVTQAELDAAIPVLTDNSLIALLDLPGQVCQPPTDAYENMTLWTLDGTSHLHETAACDNQSIVNARQALNNLVNHYF